MKKGSITKKPIYKVDLYHLLGNSYTFIDYCCDAESLGKVLVSVSKKNRNPYRENTGECIEIMEGFSIPLIDCSKSSRYDGWYDEYITELYLPYKYDYWDKYRLYLVRFEDIRESNLATLEDIKGYEPQKEVWYELLKEIQEKGINFDYEQEATEKIFGKATDGSNQNVLRKNRKYDNL